MSGLIPILRRGVGSLSVTPSSTTPNMVVWMSEWNRSVGGREGREGMQQDLGIWDDGIRSVGCILGRRMKSLR